jgi:cytochrome bd ubiquinol oxidase subunit I
MDDLAFARAQMGLSLAFHIVFAVIGIGMPALMAVWRSGCAASASRVWPLPDRSA